MDSSNMVSDIINNMRASEEKYRPATNFLEEVQTQVDASMRARTIDLLVQVAQKLMLVPETLYLTVNYMDRCLSGVNMEASELNYLGFACMMIASKYEENQFFRPRVKDFCHILDYTCSKDEVLRMESQILKYLKFELVAPTTKCFLRGFVCAAGGELETRFLALLLECLSDYIAELSLLEYNMLCFAPSLIAASTIFLAKFILKPSERPWTSTLSHYTHYRSSDLQECVMALHNLCCNSSSPDLTAIREKYSQRGYACVATMCRLPSIPQDFFHDNPENTSVHCFHVPNASVNAF